MFVLNLALSLILVPASAIAARALDAGNVVATQTGDRVGLENQVIGAKWSLRGGNVTGLVVTDRLHGTELEIDAPFAILLTDGVIYDAARMELQNSL